MNDQLDLLPDVSPTEAQPPLAVVTGSARPYECPAQMTDEEWLLDLVARLGQVIEHRIGDSITVPLELLTHVQSALIANLGAWKDSARLNWLSAKRSPGTVHLTFNGATVARAQSVRDVIDVAMRGPNAASETRGPVAPTTERGTEPRCL